MEVQRAAYNKIGARTHFVAQAQSGAPPPEVGGMAQPQGGLR